MRSLWIVGALLGCLGVARAEGKAVFIDGARPDVAAGYPTFPANTKAGWGFMVLTNMLPNQGNGQYVFQMWGQRHYRRPSS